MKLIRKNFIVRLKLNFNINSEAPSTVIPLARPLARVVKVFHGDHPKLASVSVYFQGCDVFPKCTGCHNPETWDFDESFQVDFSHLLERVIEKLQMLLLRNEKVALAILGGEPLSERNREVAYLLAKFVKSYFLDKVSVIVYTWRTPKELLNMNVPLDYFDEFVLGRYKSNYRTNKFPASKNQLYIKRQKLYFILTLLKIKKKEVRRKKRGKAAC